MKSQPRRQRLIWIAIPILSFAWLAIRLYMLYAHPMESTIDQTLLTIFMVAGWLVTVCFSIYFWKQNVDR